MQSRDAERGRKGGNTEETDVERQMEALHLLRPVGSPTIATPASLNKSGLWSAKQIRQKGTCRERARHANAAVSRDFRCLFGAGKASAVASYHSISPADSRHNRVV